MVDEPSQNLAQRMADLARTMATPSKVDDVLAEVTAAALELLPGADTAGVLMLAKNGKFESLAGTSDLIYELDRLQEHHGTGPCIDAAVNDLIVRTDDFKTEPRWHDYSRAVYELGVRSSLSFKLYTGDRTAGALNVFSLQPHAFTAESEATGSVLAAHAATAIIASREGEQLQSALLSRDVIGQAKGILMERLNVDAIRSFQILRQLSQEMNLRLTEVARRVVATRGDDS
jgi:GAF domain-containing protein